MALGTIPLLCALLLCLYMESVWNSPVGILNYSSLNILKNSDTYKSITPANVPKVVPRLRVPHPLGVVSEISSPVFCRRSFTQFYHDPESPHPLAAVSELSSRIAAHAQRDDARLPLPSPQELEAIKKVAQILIMLGEQVIPAIIGDPPSAGNCENTEDVPNDIVSP